MKSCPFGDRITETYLLYSKVTLLKIILKFLLWCGLSFLRLPHKSARLDLFPVYWQNIIAEAYFAISITSLSSLSWYYHFFYICDINVLLLTGEVYTRFWWGNLWERDHFVDLGIFERMILKWIFKKWDREALSGLIWLMIGQIAGEHLNAVRNFRVP